MKYQALNTFLRAQGNPRLAMSFADIAKVAGTPLPASAYRHPSWWANDPVHHAQARAWSEAGYKTEQVDLEAQRVVFARVPAAEGVREMQAPFTHNAAQEVHPAFGALRGTFTIAPGWDLTKPALDEGELAEWEASVDRKADLIEKGLHGKR